MFRNFYAEQKMADPRDSWYKPNLLYNIHYRPPKPATPPKIVVVTREFNPSVCTCGEHDCVPHYIMEREVVWSSKEVKKEEDREFIREIQDEKVTTKQENSNSSEDDGDSDDDGGAGGDGGDDRDEELKKDASSKKKVDDNKCMVNGMNDIKVGRLTSGIFPMTGDHRAYEYEAYIETRRDHLNQKSDSGIQEVSEAGKVRNDQMSKMAKVGQEWNQIDTDNIQELEKSRDLTNEEGMEMQHESENDEDMKRDRIKICDTVRSEFNDISSKTCNVGGTLNGEDMVQKTEDTTQLGQNSNDVGTGGNGLVSLPRFSNLAKSDTSETHVSEVKEPFIRLTVDDEEFGSAFGIMSVYCDSELHTAWKGESEFQDR